MDERFTGDDRLSGVELLALTGEGDEELLGRWRWKRPRLSRKFKKRFKKIATVASMATPAGLMYQAGKAGVKAVQKRRRKKIHGDERTSGDEALYEELLGRGDDELLGKFRFLPGLSKIGKATRKFTTAAASAFVPKSTLDLLSHMDPTKKRGAKAAPAKAIVPVPPGATKVDVKKIAIIGGAGIGSLIVLKLVLSSPRR
jgi:hypothetical protein